MMYFELGGRVHSGYFQRNWELSVNDSNVRKFIQEKRDLCDNTDFYYCLYVYDNPANRKDSNVTAPLYFDIDGKSLAANDYAQTRRECLTLVTYLKNSCHILEKEIQIYFSGAKGFHIIIPEIIFGCEAPCSNLNIMYKTFVQRIKETLNLNLIDMKIYDKRRLFRYPDSINSKTGLRKVTLTEQEVRECSIEQIKEIASRPCRKMELNYRYNSEAAKYVQTIFQLEAQRNTPTQYEREIRRTPLPEAERRLFPCARELLRTSLTEGGRNNSLVALATSLLSGGWGINEVYDILGEWNNNNSPALPEYEFQRTVRSAIHMYFTYGHCYGCTGYQSLIGTSACRDCSVNR